GACARLGQKCRVASAEASPALERLTGIVARAAGERPLVVVSAMGDTTDELVAALEEAVGGREEAARRALERLEENTAAVLDAFFGADAGGIRREIEGHFEELKRMAGAVSVLRSVPPASRDHFLAHGERISSVVPAPALQSRRLPSVAAPSRAA